MQRTRHPDFAKGLSGPDPDPRRPGLRRRLFGVGLRVFVLILMIMAMGGCREEPEDTAEDYRRRLQASGKRVLVVDEHNEPQVKLRTRHTSYKVYDDSLSPVGEVRFGDVLEEGAGDEDAPSRVEITMRPLAEQVPKTLEQVSGDSFEMKGHFRIERVDRGWGVFDADAVLLGAFEQHGSWQLRKSYEGDAVWSVDEDTEPMRSTHEGRESLKVQVGALSTPQLLAFELDGLSPLEQAAVGAWLEHARPLDES